MDATRKRRKCKVIAIKKAKDEGRDALTPLQYEHMKEIEKRLEDFFNKEEIADLRIEKIGDDLYELKEKGGPLGRINLRVYFGVIAEKGEIVILKTYKKEQDGQVPAHIITTVEDRFDDYKSGRYAHGASVHVPHQREGAESHKW